jgi:hypothetical protein
MNLIFLSPFGCDLKSRPEMFSLVASVGTRRDTPRQDADEFRANGVANHPGSEHCNFHEVTFR